MIEWKRLLRRSEVNRAYVGNHLVGHVYKKIVARGESDKFVAHVFMCEDSTAKPMIFDSEVLATTHVEARVHKLVRDLGAAL